MGPSALFIKWVWLATMGIGILVYVRGLQTWAQGLVVAHSEHLFTLLPAYRGLYIQFYLNKYINDRLMNIWAQVTKTQFHKTLPWAYKTDIVKSSRGIIFSQPLTPCGPLTKTFGDRWSRWLLGLNQDHFKNVCHTSSSVFHGCLSKQRENRITERSLV